MGKKLVIALIAIMFMAVSCGHECAVGTGKTINLDLSKSPLTGEFICKYGDMRVNFPNDSTAVLIFTENGKTYELTYQIDTIGQYYETYEEKYIN